MHCSRRIPVILGMIVIRVTTSAVLCAEPIPTGIVTLGILDVGLARTFGTVTSSHGMCLVFGRLHRHCLDPLNQQR